MKHSTYTEQTKEWLESQFRDVNTDGVYRSHQPIYGFRDSHARDTHIPRYLITYQIMKALSHLKFDTLLDIGGAEGYTAGMAKSFFNCHAESSDLSEEANKRATEIFGIPTKQIDIHALPYEDEQFDVIVCSEVLEHTEDIKTATKEVLRVCKKAAVITVPKEPESVIQRNRELKIPHAHLYSLDLNSFNFVEQEGWKVRKGKLLSLWVKLASLMGDAQPLQKRGSYPAAFAKVFDAFIPLFKMFFGKRFAALLTSIDAHIASVIPPYRGMIFILIKDDDAWSDTPVKKIRAKDVVNFSVPYHYLDKETKI